jgi:ABC-2 type transport system ATP-binding protein
MGAVQEEYKVDYIMETVGLRKSYKGNVVVNDVNIHVPKGAIYGFVGPNGAGKSTVMKMILNLIQPEAGEVQLFGEKVTDQSYEVFKRVGSIIENPYFYEKMTARQNLELHCDYMGFPNKERIDEVLQMVDLQNVEGKQIRHYSLGMKQRLAIARAILAKPEFLILDEPINALDPEGIREMRNLFQRLNQEDETTIFISSHILSEVDLIADTIGIIQHGNLLAELPIEEIHKHQTEYISLQVDDVAHAATLLEQMDITNFSVLDQEFIRIYDSNISGKVLSKALIESGVGLESLGRKQDTLEDYFFQLTEEGK